MQHEAAAAVLRQHQVISHTGLEELISPRHTLIHLFLFSSVLHALCSPFCHQQSLGMDFKKGKLLLGQKYVG